MSKRTTHAEELSPVKQALLEIRRLRAQLAECRVPRAEPIAIVGMAARLPGGIVRLDDFWQILVGAETAITATPPERWDSEALYHADADQPGKTYSCHGGFMSDIDRFDTEFFGITPREAESMDPQHRILLELTWEALEHAGIAATKLAGTDAGVFIGLSNSDYGRLLLQARDDIDAHSSFGLAGSIAAGRISYFLDVKGPSLVLDTSCSSALTALHLGCSSLAAGDASLAIVGAANLILTPEVTISFSHARMLARDGQCKAFDAAADGYVRGEGCAVVVLRRLRDAQADGDRVLAVIRGSAASHDGRSAGLTAPNGPAQTAVIRAALRSANLAPADVDYVEAHGTGTPLGDPIELQALGAAYGDGRPAGSELLIGSVKTNIGHLEAAAGLAGLVKVVLSLQHEALPPHRNFTTPNPRVAWEDLPVAVVRSLRPWPRGQRVRRAGLSSFGFSGTNVHIVLEEAPPVMDPMVTMSVDQECLFVTSGRSPDALRELAGRYVTWLDRSQACLADICDSAASGRVHHRHRLAVIARDRSELAHELKAWLAHGGTGRVKVAVTGQQAPQVGFFCPPMVEEEARADAIAFAAAFPAFAAAGDAVADAGSPEPPGGPSCAVVLQYALGRFWTAIGVRPSVVFGAGTGEIAAGTLAGLLTPAEALARPHERPASRPAESAACTFVSTRTGRTETVWPEDLADCRGSDRLAEAGQAAVAAGMEFLLVLGRDAHAAPADCGSRAAALSGAPDAARGSILLAVQALYLAGSEPDWDALRQAQRPGLRGARQDLPTYAFQRQRCWRPTAQTVPAAVPAPVIADWPKLISSVARQSETGPLGWDPATYTTRWSRFDDLTVGYAINTMVALGEFAGSGTRASVEELVSRHGFMPRYSSLVGRWLNLMADVGVLRHDGAAFVSPLPLRRRDLSAVWREVATLMADDPDMLTYAQRASGKLLDMLTGRVNPLEVLFEHGSLDRAEGIYERSPSARYMNAMAAAAVRSALEDRRGNGPFRLVEAGAGTGGTTSRLTEFFPPDGEYWFTDLSHAFLARASRRFGANPAFRFTKFNLDLPAPPELPIGATDVVLAANVVHATRDVGATLDHLRALLKPGGLLVLIESTTHLSHFDLTIAFIEGWGSFADGYRSQHPLLPVDRWTLLLRERGFVEAERFPSHGTAADMIGQHVVIARNGLDAPADGPVRTAPSRVAELAPVDAAPVDLPALRFACPVTAQRRQALEDFVRRCAARVMHLDPTSRPGPRERFSDLGMDSLMALQLQSSLAEGIGLREQLPATIAFDTGTVEGLTDQLLRLIEPTSQADDGDAEVHLPGAPGLDASSLRSASVLTAEDLEAISDDEVEAMLAHRLLAHQMKIG